MRARLATAVIALAATGVATGHVLDAGAHLVAARRVELATEVAAAALVVLAGAIALTYSLQERELKLKRFGLLFRSLPSLHAIARASRIVTTQGCALLTLAVLAMSIIPSGASGARDWDAGRIALASAWLALGIVILARRVRTDGRRPATLTLAAFSMVVACLIGLRAAP